MYWHLDPTLVAIALHCILESGWQLSFLETQSITRWVKFGDTALKVASNPRGVGPRNSTKLS